MPTERKQFLAIAGIPDFESVILTAADNPRAVCPVRHASDRTFVPFQGEQSLATAGIPDPEGVILTAADDLSAVRAYRHALQLAPQYSELRHALVAVHAEQVQTVPRARG